MFGRYPGYNQTNITKTRFTGNNKNIIGHIMEIGGYANIFLFLVETVIEDSNPLMWAWLPFTKFIFYQLLRATKHAFIK